MNEETEREQQATQLNIPVPIEWHIPDNIQSHYASNVFVQTGQYEIIISFFEMLLPLLTGSPEENKAKIEQLGRVRAECVARIIIDPDLLPKLIDALQTTLDGYNAAKREG
jgi:hypothetical protein